MPGVPVSIALQTTAHALASRGVDAGLILDRAIAAGTKASAVDALLAFLALRVEQIEQHECADESLRLKDTLIAVLGRDDVDVGAARDTNPPSWIHAYAAIPFAWVPEPDQAWHEAWTRLAEQRVRMIYSTNLAYLGADEPSLFLLYSGMATLQMIGAGERERTSVLPLLWDRLFDATLSVTLRLGSLFKRHSADRWRRTVVGLCARLPDVSRWAGGGLPDVKKLGTVLSRLGGDDGLMIECVAYLHYAGIPGQDLIDAMAGFGSSLEETLAHHLGFLDSQHPTPAVHGMFNPIDECREILKEVLGGGSSRSRDGASP